MPDNFAAYFSALLASILHINLPVLNCKFHLHIL